MRKIKDFFYDKNDIIIVLIILALAGFIIYSRIGIIMDYPEQIADEAATTVTTEEQTEPEETEDAKEPEEEGDKADSDKESGDAVKITISDSDDAVSISLNLEEAGLIESATEFEGYINNMDKAGDIKPGTYEIKKDSSFEKILNTITK